MPASRAAWLALAGAIGCEVVASLSLKAALHHPVLYAAAVGGYVSAFALLGRILRLGMPLGVAYGVWGAAGVAGTAVLSMLLFGEDLTVLTAAGLGLVVAGVLAVERGSVEVRDGTEA
ncbi:QacE family quaternary ammonium compound efflux SMR transporter [Pimelobacter simplex]|nr:QacE family quaternary ammonium compound efflux SMR transporter [Pimelobacter simplex]